MAKNRPFLENEKPVKNTGSKRLFLRFLKGQKWVFFGQKGVFFVYLLFLGRVFEVIKFVKNVKKH